MQVKRLERLPSALGMLTMAVGIVVIVALVAIQAGSQERTRFSAGAPADTTNYISEKMPSSAQTEGSLVLVNQENAWEFPNNDDLTSVFGQMSGTYSVRSSEVQVDQLMMNPLNAMMDDFYAETGRGDVNLVSGYRSKEEQAVLKEESLAADGKAHSDRYVTKAGYSEHHTGLAIDLQLYHDGVSETFTGTGAYSWIYDHCADYGFVLRYSGDKESLTGIAEESWHFRYVGVPHAQIMTEHNLCLEEYLELLQEYPWDGEHLQYGGYEIYYCEGDTIYVPKDGNYEISGMNGEGYVVTIWQN